ncbi:MAG: sulfatase [Planctomycetota bacterium]|nr:sulfatase [Planctomycetota bacterium]
MRILYLDIDSLRPDHLGCYGYHRKTSPNIDRVAGEGVRFDNLYVTDAPCLPSRTALWSGRFGIHTGVVNHGGVAAEPFNQGPDRGFRSRLGATNWMTCLRERGLKTATVSPFGERHSAWHWYAGFSEIHNTGKCGIERADEVAPVALDWIKRNARDENWFLHVNFWDPHTGYRTPASFGDPFAADPLPAWLTEEVRQQHWKGVGPHSAREIPGFSDEPYNDPELGYDSYPRQPWKADSMAVVRQMFDGYDTAILFADHYVGQLLNALADQNVLDDTVIVISSDHGENLGELNVYGDHQTADQITTRVPLIVRWPGITKQRGAKSGGPSGGPGRVDSALHYHFDFAATMIELTGGEVPAIWDGRSFADAFKAQREQGRDFLVVSQNAWSCQRSVRFEDYLAIRTYHDGYRGYPESMLFDLKRDPHEQHDLAPARPDLMARAMSMLSGWHAEMMRTATHPTDPMWTVLSEGGPAQTRGTLKAYCDWLRKTDRGHWADFLIARHPTEYM